MLQRLLLVPPIRCVVVSPTSSTTIVMIPTPSTVSSSTSTSSFWRVKVTTPKPTAVPATYQEIKYINPTTLEYEGVNGWCYFRIKQDWLLHWSLKYYSWHLHTIPPHRHACTHTHTYYIITQTHMYTYVHTHICTYTHIHTCTHAHIHTYYIIIHYRRTGKFLQHEKSTRVSRAVGIR